MPGNPDPGCSRGLSADRNGDPATGREILCYHRARRPHFDPVCRVGPEAAQQLVADGGEPEIGQFEAGRSRPAAAVTW